MRAGRIKNVDIHQAECDRLLRFPGGAVWREVSQQRRTTEAAAKKLAPVDTGRGRSSITTAVFVRGQTVVGWVGTNVPYMRIQHEGTGPIYPKKAKALRFKPKGENFFVFAQKTKGVPATKFLTKAVELSSPWYAG